MTRFLFQKIDVVDRQLLNIRGVRRDAAIVSLSMSSILLLYVLSCFLAVIPFVEPFAGVLAVNDRPKWILPSSRDCSTILRRPLFDKTLTQLTMKNSNLGEKSNVEPARRPSIPVRGSHPILFRSAAPPYIAILTEPDACDSEERWNATMQALQKAISTRRVHLISVRLTRTPSSDDDEERLYQSRYTRMIQQLRTWSVDDAYPSFYLVVSSGAYMDLGLRLGVDGVHFKEAHRSQIPQVRDWYRDAFPDSQLLVGTSVHSIPSAVEAYQMYQPDYLFVGTCYATASHPDKGILEGPELPSQVCDALCFVTAGAPRPVVLAIGGIAASNCAALLPGPDGVAVIRSVLRAPDPAAAVQSIFQEMEKARMKN